VGSGLRCVEGYFRGLQQGCFQESGIIIQLLSVNHPETSEQHVMLRSLCSPFGHSMGMLQASCLHVLLRGFDYPELDLWFLTSEMEETLDLIEEIVA